MLFVSADSASLFKKRHCYRVCVAILSVPLLQEALDNIAMALLEVSELFHTHSHC